MDHATTLKTLAHLIEACHDGHDGYQAAAHAVEDMATKKRLGRYAIERRGFGEVLATEVERLGGRPPERGTLKGAAHRGFLQLMDTARHPSPERILAECVRGETEAMRAYDAALPKLPPHIRSVAEEHLGRIAEVREEIREATTQGGPGGVDG